MPYDLSDVMFITTANLLDPIQPAFRDRMEIIRISGYTEEEKLAIARKHLVPRQVDENGLTPEMIDFSDNTLSAMISGYTREAGLRGLERSLARVCRKVARQVAEGRKASVRIITSSLDSYLGPAPITRSDIRGSDQAGVATGLAWTEAGGDILHIEVTTMDGKGGLTLTGQLGDVMKESAQAALSYTRSHAADFGLPKGFFDGLDIHIHVPEGAIPKDGPSAGITMATAMISAFTNRKVRRDLAMTGEITLRGNVLPVGGIKEKVLAARQYGIRTLILPASNKKNLEEIAKSIRKEMEFVLVGDVRQVLEKALGLPETARTSVRPGATGARPPVETAH